MPTVELRPSGRAIDAAPGTPLRDVLADHGVEFPCGGRGRCCRCRVRVLEGELPATGEQEDLLDPTAIAEGWRLACKTTVETSSVIEVEAWKAPVLVDDTPLELDPRTGRGIAIDLGTTTLAAQLLDLQTGEVLAVETALNPQAVHGADIMSRIELALEGGRPELVSQIRGAVAELTARLLREAGSGPALEQVVIVGNTVMHHLFCDLDVEPLSRYPFSPSDGEEQTFPAGSLGCQLPDDPPVRFLGCLGGFVGSDVMAGIASTGLHDRPEISALVDLGTNGEVVVGNRDRILCASTAAGPAFEAGGIGMGMRATTGAISEVATEGGRLACHVIGNGPARGLCGSGLVDTVAAALDLGWIEPSGRLARGVASIELDDSVSLNQRDIRQLQLAKGAVAAGLRVLRHAWGDGDAEVHRVFLSGAFGNYVNRESARRIGLIDVPVDQMEPAGNTALLGAKLCLLGERQGDLLADIASRAEHVSLAADPTFEDTFVDEMRFPAP